MREYEFYNGLEGKDEHFLVRAMELVLLDIEEIYKVNLDIEREKFRFIRYIDKLLELRDGESDKGRLQRLYEVLTLFSFNEKQLNISELMVPAQYDEALDVGELTVNQVIEAMGGNLKLSDIK